MVHRGIRFEDKIHAGYKVISLYLIGPLIRIEILTGTSLTIDFQWHHYGL